MLLEGGRLAFKSVDDTDVGRWGGVGLPNTGPAKLDGSAGKSGTHPYPAIVQRSIWNDSCLPFCCNAT